MNMNKAMQFLLRGLLMTTMLFAVSAVAQDAHNTGQFQGPKANKGHVTHSTRDGKSVLTLSDDFVVPDTPDPHWQAGGLRRQRLSGRQAEEEGLHRRQVPEGNRRAQLREERVESSDLVRVWPKPTWARQASARPSSSNPQPERREPIRTWTFAPFNTQREVRSP